MLSFDIPTTTDSLVTGLKRQRREISYFFGALSVEEFFAPQGDHWSPAGHLRILPSLCGRSRRLLQDWTISTRTIERSATVSATFGEPYRSSCDWSEE